MTKLNNLDSWIKGYEGAPNEIVEYHERKIYNCVNENLR